MSLVVSTVYAEFLIQAMYVYRSSERFQEVMRPFIKLLP